MKFYVMYASPSVEDYVKAGEAIQPLERGCLMSEFQFLDHSRLTVEADENGGITFVDFIQAGEAGCIPLISDRFYQILKNAGVDYLFYKPVDITISELGYCEHYWLALPPRIYCLNESQSTFREKQQYPRELRKVENIVISERNIGRYQIFQLAGTVNEEIIVKEELKTIVEKSQLLNVHFYELQEEI